MTAQLYPSDLFSLRRDVRDYGKEAKASRESIRAAERIAVLDMCTGASQSAALTAARNFLWKNASHGYSPRGAA